MHEPGLTQKQLGTPHRCKRTITKEVKKSQSLNSTTTQKNSYHLRSSTIISKTRKEHERKRNRRKVVKPTKPQDLDRSPRPPQQEAKYHPYVLIQRLPRHKLSQYNYRWQVPQLPLIAFNFPEHLHRLDRNPKIPSHNPNPKENPFDNPYILKTNHSEALQRTQIIPIIKQKPSTISYQHHTSKH